MVRQVMEFPIGTSPEAVVDHNHQKNPSQSFARNFPAAVGKPIRHLPARAQYGKETSRRVGELSGKSALSHRKPRGPPPPCTQICPTCRAIAPHSSLITRPYPC